LTYENFDPITGIRIGRTFILTNLQKLYLDYNDSQSLEYMNSSTYYDAFYLFEVYYKLVKFFRMHQNDLIKKSFTLEKAKELLLKEINKFIELGCRKLNKTFDHYLQDENILLNINDYHIQGKTVTNTSDEINKITVLRIEIKRLVSIHSNRRIGSVLYCDSFLMSNSEIFNLTQDILPFKFIHTAKIHLTGRDNIDYDPLNILRINSNIKFSEIEAKGIVFYRNEYNISYLFPDSQELGYDHNQMFYYLCGKLYLFDDYLMFFDNSIGHVVIDEKNLKEIAIKDEMRYTVILLTLQDSEKIPLSNICKNEIILYIPGNNTKIKSIKYEMISFLKTRFTNKFKIFSNLKENEYDLAIRTISDNENDNLNYVSNSFNITNITDIILELFEYEFLSTMKFWKNDKLNFNEYKYIRESIANYESNPVDVDPESNHKKTKIVLLFCSHFDNLDKFTKYLLDLGKIYTTGSIKVVFPSLNLINDEKSFYEFYCKSLLEHSSQKIKVVLVIVFNEIKVNYFLYNLVMYYEKFNPSTDKKSFLKEFQILSISYAVNLKYLIKNKNKDFLSRVYEISDEDLVNFILIEEDYLSKEKIEFRNKLISSMNSKAITFNTRSFSKNKEVSKIFTEKNLVNPKKISFHFDILIGDLKLNHNHDKKEECFIKLKYKIKKELFEEFLNNHMNIPQLYSHEKKLKDLQNFSEGKSETVMDSDGKDIINRNYLNTDDLEQKFVEDLTEEVKKLKRAAAEPIIEKVVGYVKFIKHKSTDEIVENKIYFVKSCYKEKSIEVYEEKVKKISTEEIGLLLYGENIKSNLRYLHDLILEFSGEIPESKEYKNKNNLTEAEMRNLNAVNLKREIPPGWKKDGAIFIDPEGNIHYSHPCNILIYNT